MAIIEKKGDLLLQGREMAKLRYSRLAQMLSLGVVVLLSGCSSMTVLNPKGQVGDDERSLILTAGALMLIVVVPVIVMTFLFAWKYRESNKKAKYSPEWAHSKKIETIVWIVPGVIVLALAILAWTTSHSLDPFKPLDAKAKPIKIEVVSLDWKWLFIYPDQRIAAVNQIVFPTNVPVDFYLTSGSVMNSFFIPQLGSQIYTMAGMETQLHLIANEAGTYNGISANFSGRGFSGMTFTALATSERQFNAWVKKIKQSSKKLDQYGYQELAEPSQNNPVEYFATVKPHLFHDIIDSYADKQMSSASME